MPLAALVSVPALVAPLKIACIWSSAVSLAPDALSVWVCCCIACSSTRSRCDCAPVSCTPIPKLMPPSKAVSFSVHVGVSSV